MDTLCNDKEACYKVGFIKNMKFNDLKKYSIPFIITITGYDGKRKLTLARELSKN